MGVRSVTPGGAFAGWGGVASYFPGPPPCGVPNCGLCINCSNVLDDPDHGMRKQISDMLHPILIMIPEPVSREGSGAERGERSVASGAGSGRRR